MNTQDKLSARARITLKLHDLLKEQPINEAGVTACEVAINALDRDLNSRVALYIEMSQSRD